MEQIRITEQEIRLLETAYTGRKAYHGELHDHSNSGGTSDGAVPLAEYAQEMLIQKMDFAAILDHKQVRHMYLEAFDPERMICGTEPGTKISDSTASKNSLHYNMLFTNPEALQAVLEAFPEYEFTGGTEGHFKYPEFTRQRFAELMDAVTERGGFFVVPHPKQVMESENPLDYWFRDHTGIEVFYNDYESEATAENHALWLELLRFGKRVWACAGGDKHEHPDTGALTTIYSDRRHGAAYIPYLRKGDFTCGSVGVRMLLHDVHMGGETVFDGGKLLIAVGDFHETVCKADHTYTAEIWDDKGIVCSGAVCPGETRYFALPSDPYARWYRVEVRDETSGSTIALGNPIWNVQPKYRVTVDPDRTVGRIKPMNGVGGGPVNGDFDYDTTEYYKAAAIPFGRTHDIERPYGSGEYVDIHCIFPNFDADVNDPDNYNFVLTDVYLEAMCNAGTKPFYRLGTTIEQQPPVKRYVFPPKDYRKWGEICSHIIAHYNKGWANGFTMGIEYWEIWNEPELTRACWNSSDEEFIHFYETAASVIKRDHPDIKIGGCGFARPTGELSEKLLDHLKQSGAPMDFYTWHQYVVRPEQAVQCAENVEKMLRSHGFPNTESIYDEWNYVRGWDDSIQNSIDMHKTAHGAAFTAAVMAAMQNTPADAAIYYDAQVKCQLWNGLFTPGRMHIFGEVIPVVAEKPYYAFLAWGALRKAGIQVHLTADHGLYAVAARDGEEITLLVSRYSDDGFFAAVDTEKAEITLDFGEDVTAAEAWLTDRTHTNEPIPFDGKTLELEQDAFALLKVRCSK